MKIDNLNDLKKLIKACRELGVEAIKVDGIELAINHNLGLGRNPVKRSKTLPDYSSDFPEAGLRIPTQNSTTGLPKALKSKPEDVPDLIDMPDELSAEQLLFYSAASQEPSN